MQAAAISVFIIPLLIAIILKLIILKWYHPTDPGEVTSVELYYSNANRITGYIVLCFIPFATGSFVLFQQPGLASVFLFVVFAFFSFGFFAKFSCRVLFDQSGIRGEWFLLPVSKSWADITNVTTMRSTLGTGYQINFSQGHGPIRRMRFTLAIEGYEKLAKLLEERNLAKW